MMIDETDEELMEQGPQDNVVDFGTSLQHDNIQRQLAQNAELHQKSCTINPKWNAPEMMQPNVNQPIIK